MIAPLLNFAESALANSPPVAGQFPFNQTAVTAAKTASGLGSVPNALLGGLAAANPLSALAGGVASALSAPMPSLTATVNSDPSVRYGDNFIRNTVGANKQGGITVGSGNAEARQAANSTSWIWWIVGAVVLIGGFLWVRRG